MHDNPALLAASRADHLLPVYILPERELMQHPDLVTAFDTAAPAKMGLGRRYYLQSALRDVHESLREKHTGLVFRSGSVAAEILNLCESYGITDVYTTELPGTEEVQDLDETEELLDAAGIRLHVFESHTLYHPDDLPFTLERMPDVFTPFRKQVEKYTRVRDEVPTPLQLPSLPEYTGSLDELRIENILTDEIHVPGAVQRYDPRSAMPSDGGEKAALKHVRHYIWEDHLIKTYKETRNGLVGQDFSSKLSGWLSVGALSPKYVYRHIKLFEKQVIANDSTYWLVFELLWRDFFQFLMLKYDGQLFTLSGISEEHAEILHPDTPVNKRFGFRQDADAFKRWTMGETDSDFVNASMVEVSKTGFMSNRGRQNVASYLAKTMGVDWRWGAAWFESVLLDYDVASNWGNWAYVSGVGTDPRDRVFNVDRQAEMYDKSGEFRRLWLEDTQNGKTA